jgi:hypothetical protein
MKTSERQNSTKGHRKIGLKVRLALNNHPYLFTNNIVMKKQIIIGSAMLFAMCAAIAQGNEAYVYETGVGSNEAYVEQIGEANFAELNQYANYDPTWGSPNNYAEILQDGSENEAYVDQTAFWGHESFVDQTGYSNLVTVDLYRNGNTSTAIQDGCENEATQYITGKYSEVYSDQTGSHNDVVQHMGYTGDLVGQDNFFEAYQDGDYNDIYQQLITGGHFDGTSNTSYVDQTGDCNDATVTIGDGTMVPDGNEANIVQDGDGNWADILQIGDDNYGYITSMGDDNIADLDQLGNGNYAIINQSE